MSNGALYQLIYDIIAKIPTGRVATYGQVARMAGIPGRARQIGYALHHLPEDSDVPWHRVVNAKGTISLTHSETIQREILELEGVVFDAYGTIDLGKFQW